MKRFKAAIANEGGSYNEVGMTYDDQQYYSQYNYDTTQMQGDMYGHYYPTYTEEQSVGTALLQGQPATIVPFLQQHHEIQQQQQLQQQQQQEIQQQQQPLQEEEVEVFVPPKELNIPTDMEAVSLPEDRNLLSCCLSCIYLRQTLLLQI
jgi:hypothetical protein